MAIKRCKKDNGSFSMSSMTDIVFLLLIFFMVTSTLINPNALKLVLPKSTNQTSSHPGITVSIDRNNVYYLNSQVTSFIQLEKQIVELANQQNPDDVVISIQADKSVQVEYVVRVMNIAKNNNYKAILATQPE